MSKHVHSHLPQRTTTHRVGGPNLLGGDCRALKINLGDWSLLRAALESFEQDQRNRLEELLADHPELKVTTPLVAGHEVQDVQYIDEALGIADDIEDCVTIQKRVAALFVGSAPSASSANPPTRPDTYNPLAGLPEPAPYNRRTS